MAFFTYNDRKVFYNVNGDGQPLIIIHGNSVSSKMHSGFAKKLKKNFQTISIDLPGHGQSERIDNWPVDFWYEHARVINALIDHLDLDNVILLGYSGGAIIALNAALEYPEKLSKVIADSFQGEEPLESFAKNIFADRAKAKKNLFARMFWFYMHGKDWKKVVDNDSAVIFEHYEKYKKYFHHDISEIQIPVFLTGSVNDEFIDDIHECYSQISDKFNNCELKIYKNGKHPASLTVGKEYINDLIKFVKSYSQ